MKCESCDVEMRDRVATPNAPYAYTLSGLTDVFLTGIIVRECERCKSRLPVIPYIEELHQLIARIIVSKPSQLSGDEVRFLRKNAGFSATKFAALLKVDPAHLSRVENGHTKSLGEQTDHLARAVAIAAKDGEAARAVLLEMADKILAGTGQDKSKSPRRPPAKVAARRVKYDKKSGWRLAA